MSGAPPLTPSLRDIHILLSAARQLDDDWGATLELCILTLALPWEILSVELEDIDWNAGFVTVRARGGVRRILALPDAAMKAILRVAGKTRRQGQAVTAGRGQRLAPRLFRLDRLIDRLAAAVPETVGLGEWNFHGIRAAAADSLQRHGASRMEVEAVLGRQTRRDGARTRGDPELAAIGAERWCRILQSDTAEMR